MNSKNEVFEYLIDQLRQQVTNNPYKQQREDLAYEVQSLKNRLRDASKQIKELHLALATAAGDVEAYKLIRKGGYVNGGQRYERYVVGEHGPEQSGRRKDGTHECYHNWRFVNGKAPAVCVNCGVTKPEECEHEWEYYYPNGRRCTKCGAINL